jgi:hypothetical protein
VGEVHHEPCSAAGASAEAVVVVVAAGEALEDEFFE